MGAFLDPISNEKNRRYKVWLSQSEYDLKAAKDSFNAGNYEWACYQSIQSVEKILKSVIVHSGYKPPKTHKLSILISMSNRANKLFQNVKFSFRKIEGYTFISRYPFVLPGQNQIPHENITKNDAEACIRIAEDIQNKVDNFLRENKPTEGKDIEMQDYYFTREEVETRIKEVIEKLLKTEKLNVKKVLLFGSFAREKERPRSTTMDILVVADTELSFVERIQHVRMTTKGSEPIIEPIVYTPDEFKMMLEDEGEGFLESAIQEGVTLYDVKI
jgi:HEPN domain-containing protein/predicted nucleotidyltransferase